MKKVCGTCNFQNDVDLDMGRMRWTCFLDNNTHEETDTCKNWQELSSLSKSDRLKIATDLKTGREAERRHHDILKENSKNRKSQRLIAIIIFILGVISTLIIQFIMKRYF